MVRRRTARLQRVVHVDFHGARGRDSSSACGGRVLIVGLMLLLLTIIGGAMFISNTDCSSPLLSSRARSACEWLHDTEQLAEEAQRASAALTACLTQTGVWILPLRTDDLKALRGELLRSPTFSWSLANLLDTQTEACTAHDAVLDMYTPLRFQVSDLHSLLHQHAHFVASLLQRDDWVLRVTPPQSTIPPGLFLSPFASFQNVQNRFSGTLAALHKTLLALLHKSAPPQHHHLHRMPLVAETLKCFSDLSVPSYAFSETPAVPQLAPLSSADDDDDEEKHALNIFEKAMLFLVKHRLQRNLEKKFQYQE